MTPEELLSELEATAQEMNIHLRYEKGDFEGGYCILRDDRVIVINKKLSPQRKTSVIATALGEIGIEEKYLKPAIREFIEDELAKIKK